MPSCVLAYSGGLDTSVILGWLQDEGYTVHAVYVDLGQPCEDRQAILNKAKQCGAASSRIIDAQEELRLKDVMEQLRDVPNKDELLASMRAPQKAFHRRVEVFLGYFAIPGVTIRRFDDLELGVSGWAVMYENKTVRAFQLKSESMPQPEEKQPNKAPEPTRGTGAILFFQSRRPRVAQL